MSDRLYDQLLEVTEKAKEYFRSNGFVIPTQEDNDRVRIGRYTIERSEEGFAIFDQDRNLAHDVVNLPETAILVANAMALGKPPNHNVMLYDQRYGFSHFDLINSQRLARSRAAQHDEIGLHSCEVKQQIALEKMHANRKLVTEYFEKLYSFI